MNIRFAETLTLLMREEGWTRTELSRRTMIPVSTINAWLTTHRQPNFHHLWQLADCFQVSLDVLVGRAEYEKKRGARRRPLYC